MRLFKSLLLTFLAVGILNSCNKNQQTSVPPTANFSYTPLTGYEPLDVSFINNSINANSYTWDFGNGQTDSAFEPRVTYSKAGIYNITLEAKNTSGKDIISKTINVQTLPTKMKITSIEILDFPKKKVVQGKEMNYDSPLEGTWPDVYFSIVDLNQFDSYFYTLPLENRKENLNPNELPFKFNNPVGYHTYQNLDETVSVLFWDYDEGADDESILGVISSYSINQFIDLNGYTDTMSIELNGWKIKLGLDWL